MNTGSENIAAMLERAGIKATSNRILVLRAIMESEGPASLPELEASLETLDKSSIFRVLTLLEKNHVVHAVEDGRGIECYELCGGRGKDCIGEIHAHFYCTECRRVYCLENVAAPAVPLPEGFRATSVNYMLKGICPSCRRTDDKT